MSGIDTIEYLRGASLPACSIYWYDIHDDPYQLSGYTGSARIFLEGTLVKTISGSVTCQNGVGLRETPGSIPSAVVNWATSDLDLDENCYTLEVTATDGSSRALKRIATLVIKEP